MLELKPNCQCCDRDLDPSERGAMICSFECTYCRACATDVLHLVCPNCGGEIVDRPTRATALLADYPPGTQRAALIDRSALPG